MQRAEGDEEKVQRVGLQKWRGFVDRTRCSGLNGTRRGREYGIIAVYGEIEGRLAG